MRLTNILNKLPSPRKPALVLLLSLGISTLYGCIKPVDYDAFFEDEKVINLIYNSKIGRFFISDIQFNVEDLSPELKNSKNPNYPIREGETVTLRKSLSESAEITVSNADIYKEIYWFYNGTTLLTEEDKFTVNTAEPLFLNAKTYSILVVGVTEDDQVYGTSFKIVVES